jgi:hypothetical protein
MVPRAVDLALIYAMVLVPWIFAAAYHWRTRGAWRRSTVGWHLMAIAVVDSGPFLHVALAVWWPVLASYEMYQWSYRLSIAAMVLVTAWRVFMVFARPPEEQVPMARKE